MQWIQNSKSVLIFGVLESSCPHNCYLASRSMYQVHAMYDDHTNDGYVADIKQIIDRHHPIIKGHHLTKNI